MNKMFIKKEYLYIWITNTMTLYKKITDTPLLI